MNRDRYDADLSVEQKCILKNNKQKKETIFIKRLIDHE